MIFKFNICSIIMTHVNIIAKYYTPVYYPRLSNNLLFYNVSNCLNQLVKLLIQTVIIYFYRSFIIYVEPFKI